MTLPQGAVLALGIALLVAGCTGERTRSAAPNDVARPAAPQKDLAPRVILETSKGTIVLQLDRQKAPQTVANFLRHAQGGFYNGLIFHRVIPGFMIQAGTLTPDMQTRRTTLMPIMNEADNGLHNSRGTVAMARTAYPHGATSQFFINVADNTKLDFRDSTAQGWGYAVFGKVVEGMDVVSAIAAVPTTSRDGYRDIPVDPVVIDRAFVAGGETARK